MAQIHLQHSNRPYLFACFRRNKMRSGMSEAMFIDRYTKANGVNFCSKCATVLIKEGKLKAADTTVPQDLSLVMKKVAAGTETLRVEYMEKTKQFAERRFEALTVLSKEEMTYWYKSYKVKTRIAHSSQGIIIDENRLALYPDAKETLQVIDYNRDYYKMQRARENTLSIVKAGYEAFLKSEITHAKRHYQDSVMKLSNRILEKSLNVQKLKVTSGHVGINIETTITDGVNVVSAWTIIASGQIVRPHYRYLVK